jgi:hypothetical protein
MATLNSRNVPVGRQIEPEVPENRLRKAGITLVDYVHGVNE